MFDKIGSGISTGPFIGCYMALILDNKVHIDVTKPKIDEDKKEK
jgi:hypothetical protein